MASRLNASDLSATLGDETRNLLEHCCRTISRDRLHLPGPDFVDHSFSLSDRNNRVLASLQRLYQHGRLGGTGYLSILPVDQGVEHSAGASFAPNPDYFDPDNIVRLAIEGGCNAVASTPGVMGLTARKYAHKIPYIVKINHNELLSHPTRFDQRLFGNVRQAHEMGAVAVGATIYFGSQESSRQIETVAAGFVEAHRLGMATVLWCYLRNAAFVGEDTDYHTAADLTGQANHLGVTLQADLIKQKLADTNGGFQAIPFGKYVPEMYDQPASGHPIDLARYQVANCYMGRIGLINSGGASGDDDFRAAVRTSVINNQEIPRLCRGTGRV